MTIAHARIERTHVQQARNTGLLAGLDDTFHQLNMDSVETLPVAPFFIQNSRHADDCIGTGKLFDEHVRVINIGLHQLDARYHADCAAVIDVT